MEVSRLVTCDIFFQAHTDDERENRIENDGDLDELKLPLGVAIGYFVVLQCTMPVSKTSSSKSLATPKRLTPLSNPYTAKRKWR